MYLEIHQPLPENHLAPMVNLLIVGNLLKDFQVGADEFPGSWISLVFALAIIGFLLIITLQCAVKAISSLGVCSPWFELRI